MSWALEKRLTETVPLSTHNTCIRHHRDIVIEPNICFGRSKKSLTDIVHMYHFSLISQTFSVFLSLNLSCNRVPRVYLVNECMRFPTASF